MQQSTGHTRPPSTHSPQVGSCSVWAGPVTASPSVLFAFCCEAKIHLPGPVLPVALKWGSCPEPYLGMAALILLPSFSKPCSQERGMFIFLGWCCGVAPNPGSPSGIAGFTSSASCWKCSWDNTLSCQPTVGLAPARESLLAQGHTP